MEIRRSRREGWAKRKGRGRVDEGSGGREKGCTANEQHEEGVECVIQKRG